MRFLGLFYSSVEESLPIGNSRLNDDVTSTEFDPCSHTVLIRWAPTVSFYENRLRPLLKWENDGLLNEFRVTPDMIGARLNGAELFVESTGLELYGAKSIDKTFAMTLEGILDCVKPKGRQSVGILLQYLIPLNDVSYDDARFRGLAAIQTTDLRSIGANDFAVIVTGSAWNLEAGIVQSEELPMRIGRDVGGFSQLKGSRIALNGAGKPPVAFFADISWSFADTPPASGAAEWILGKIPEAVEQSRPVISSVFQGITAGTREYSEGTKR